MVKKTMKLKDGKYHIKGKKYKFLYGSRAQVMHGTAYKTNDSKFALKKEDLMKNKYGLIVAKYKIITGKKEGKKTKSKKTRRRR
tara:strand:+ start:20531 stop:20782 length:252 start_codon:yes stop_codon:yes gene_type:complete